MWALQHWRESFSTRFSAVYQTPVSNLVGKVKATVELVFNHFARPSLEDVSYGSCHEHADSRPKSR